MKNNAFFDKKSDFYEKNTRFSRLIDFYANKLRDPHSKGELWSFLWLIMQRKPPPPNDKYIAVCIRNEYIRLAKSEQLFASYPLRDPLVYDDLNIIEDRELTFLAFEKLTTKEKMCVVLQILYDVSPDDIAKKYGISRQAVHKNKVRGLKKMRCYIELIDKKENV